MKTKLCQHFGEIVITDINGKPNVVTFRTTAAVLQDFYAQRDNVDIEEQKMNINSSQANKERYQVNCDVK